MRGPGSQSRTTMVRLLAAVAVFVLVTACGEEGETELAVAQARVEEREQELTAARDAAGSAAATFCTQSESYVLALDRYADVLRDSEPTVGDVRDAGTDLRKPQADVVASAEQAVVARDAVVQAELALVDAQNELAQLTAGTKGPEPSEVKTGTAEDLVPKVPTATMDRVKRAEAEFADAVDGISDDTLLDQASEQVNAAAVALELSWLRLLADVGCLTKDQKKDAEAAVHDYTVALQQSLATVGYYKGEVDGIYGPKTVEAVETLQTDNDLPVTGTVDNATAKALESELKALGKQAEKDAIATTAAVQQTLTLTGYYSGPIDGVWTDELTEAVTSLQADLDVKQTGEIDARTVSAIQEAVETARERVQSPAPTEEPMPTEDTS